MFLFIDSHRSEKHITVVTALTLLLSDDDDQQQQKNEEENSNVNGNAAEIFYYLFIRVPLNGLMPTAFIVHLLCMGLYS